MRIATEPTAAALRPVPPTTPAEAFVRDGAWLLAKGSVVVGLVPSGPNAVRVVVADPFVVDEGDRVPADRLAADSAMAVLEQAAHGVRLIPVTRDGYEGKLRELAPAQLTFATGLPGVQRHDLEPRDIDGDGFTGPDEVVHRIEVNTAADAQRIDWLLRDRFDEGVVYDGPVEIVVPLAPVVPVPSVPGT